MYLNYFGLNREPFHVTPDPEFLFASPSHREAFAALSYGIGERKGFILLSGEVGVGKTTVLRAFLRQQRDESFRVLYLFNPVLSYEELLGYVLTELGHPAPLPEGGAARVTWLQEFLIGEFEQGRGVALVIDEAQNMPRNTLEQLRMLSNLETSKDKLLQIVLAGQPELDAMLQQHELRQLRQRIAVRVRVKSLTPRETEEYIQHRIGLAGGACSSIFSARALRRLVRLSGGNPRRVNILCDNVLVAAYGARQLPVSKRLVDEAAKNVLDNAPGGWWPRLLRPAVMTVALLALVGAAYALKDTPLPALPSTTTLARETPAPVAPETIKPKEASAPQGVKETPQADRVVALPSAFDTKDPVDAAPEGTTEGAAETQSPPSAAAAAPPASAPVGEGSAEASPKVADVPSPPPPVKSATEAPTPARAATPILETLLVANTAPPAIEAPPVPEKDPVSVEGENTPPALSPLPPVKRGEQLPEPARFEEVIIASGESISKVAVRRYGRCTTELLTRLQQYNPAITDISYVMAGQRLRMPVWTPDQRGVPTAMEAAPTTPAGSSTPSESPPDKGTSS